MVHTTEKTSSTTPSSASSQQAADPSLQRAKGQQHLDPATVQGSAQIGTDVPPGTTELITRSEAGSLHPGGDASRAAGKQAETEAAAAAASIAHPETSANPDEEIKAGTLKACATLQSGIALIQRFGEDAALGPRTREKVTQSFQKAIDGIDQKGDLSLADQTQRRLLEIGVALYSVTANLLDPEVSGSYERKEKCILDSTSALAAPVKEWETNTHLTPQVINGLLGAVLELYPMVGQVVSAWMQKSGEKIDGLAASKKGSGAQADDVFTAGDSKYRALADETKSLMKLTHLFLHFSTSVGEFYPRLTSPSTQTNINAMEVLTRQTEKLLHLKGVPAANTLVKDSFAVLADGAKLFSKVPNARPLYRSLQRTMEFWGVLGKWIDQKLASAKSQASRLHPDMIALFNGYGNELAIELQQLASEMESQKFPGVEDSARLNMVTALRHASESLDILSSALEVTKKIDTHVAPAPNQTLTQQLKTAYDKLNVSDTGQALEAWQRLLKEIDPPERKESSAPLKKKDEVEASAAPTALSAEDIALLAGDRVRFTEAVGELKRLKGTDIERVTRELLKAQTVKNGLPVRMAKAEKFEQEAAKTIDRGIQAIRKQLAQLESTAATLEDLGGEKGPMQEAAALRAQWEEPLARLEKEKANYLAKGWSSVTHRVNLFQTLPTRSERIALIESKQITKVELVLWQTRGPNRHLRAWNLHATNGEHQQHHIFVDDNGVPLFSHTKPVGEGGSDDAWHGRTPDDPKLLKEDLETLTRLSGGWLPDPYQGEFDVPLRDVALTDFIRQ